MSFLRFFPLSNFRCLGKGAFPTRLFPVSSLFRCRGFFPAKTCFALALHPVPSVAGGIVAVHLSLFNSSLNSPPEPTSIMRLHCSSATGSRSKRVTGIMYGSIVFEVTRPLPCHRLRVRTMELGAKRAVAKALVGSGLRCACHFFHAWECPSWGCIP